MTVLRRVRMMQPNGYNNGDKVGENPFFQETHVFILEILERRPSGFEIHAISDPSLHIVRARLNESSSFKVGDRVEIEGSSIGSLSSLRYRDLSNESINSLLETINQAIIVNPDAHLSFFNRANNISLKMHAFQLLPGVGKSTAQNWVKIRGPNGWVDFSEVNEKLEVDAISLLAERYVRELADPNEIPSLLELLVRISA